MTYHPYWKNRRINLEFQDDRKPAIVTYYTKSDEEAIGKAKKDYDHVASKIEIEQ